MISGNINNKQVNIPTSWQDVTFEKYIAFLDCETSLSQVSTLLDMPVTVLDKLNSEGLGAILMAMSFMQESPAAYSSELPNVDIGKESYEKLELSKAALMAVDKPYKALIKIVKIYTNVDYSQMPTSIANPIAAFFLTSCLSSLNDTKDLTNTHQAQPKQ